jgi:general secretion pathway protein N
MLTKKRLMAAGLATFIVGVLLTFPARVPYGWFSSPDFRLSGISGTVWRGQAAEGFAAGIYLRDLQWSFQPLSIFRGRLAYRVESNNTFGTVRSVVGVGLSGAVTLEDFASTSSLQEFRDMFQLQGFDGTLQADFESIVLENGFPTTATGSVRLSNLLAPQLSPHAIGDYRAEFTTSPDGILGQVEDSGGVLDVAGTIVLGLDRSYSFVGTVAALPDAPPGLSNQLRFLGSPDARGYRDFRIEGRL